mgnify:FL=1
MKKTKRLGPIAFIAVSLFLTACTRNPSSKIYNMWSLDQYDSLSIDSGMLADITREGITYTFSKDGKYSISGALYETGTFEINEDATMLILQADGVRTVYDVQLNERMLKLTSGEQSKTFKVKE